MPYVSITTAVPVPAEKQNTLQKEIARLISIIPGKNADNCMIHIQGDAAMYMSGGPAKALFCEVRLFGAAPAQAKAQLTEQLNALFETELGAERVYISFMEFAEWGRGGQYVTR